jgi:hypothetical protein
MAKKATTLHDNLGNELVPVTNASITYMDDGNSVQAEIEDLKLKTQYNKGHYTTEQELLNVYPNGIQNAQSRKGWYAIIGETDTVWIWDIEGNKWVNSGTKGTGAVDSVNGLDGEVILTGGNINATATINDTSTTKLINAHLTDIYNNTVDLSSPQTITGTKVFTEVIGLANTSEGTIDQIKHINNNFLITSGTGENLLNIDEGLETISAFNRELAFKDEIGEIGDYVTEGKLSEEIQNVTDMIPTKVSELTNDVPYATQQYVLENGGMIDTISVNGVPQANINKNVNINVPTNVVQYGVTTSPNANSNNQLLNITTKAKDGSSVGNAILSAYEKGTGVSNGVVLNLATNNGNTANINLADTQNRNTVNISSMGVIQRLTEGDLYTLVLPNKDGTLAMSSDIPTDYLTSSDLSSKQDALTATQLQAVNSGANTTNIGQISTNTNSINDINDLIPTQASSTNQLADKDFVNSSINSMSAFYITSNANGDPFATKSALTSATTFYSGGQIVTPTRNDYAIVLQDESENNATTRYIYYNQWEYQYTVNSTSLTAEQLSAINSGITSTLVGKISSNEQMINSLSEQVANDYVPETRTINNKPLSSNIILNASDVGALPSTTVIPTVNNGALTIQKNGQTVATFSANQSNNVTANITIPNECVYDLIIRDQNDFNDWILKLNGNRFTGRSVAIVNSGTPYTASYVVLTGNISRVDGIGNPVIDITDLPYVEGTLESAIYYPDMPSIIGAGCSITGITVNIRGLMSGVTKVVGFKNFTRVENCHFMDTLAMEGVDTSGNTDIGFEGCSNLYNTSVLAVSGTIKPYVDCSSIVGASAGVMSMATGTSTIFTNCNGITDALDVSKEIEPSIENTLYDSDCKNIWATKEEIPNTSNFITKSVNDLEYYSNNIQLDTKLNNKQDKITSTNKLSNTLISGLGTVSTLNTGTSSGNVPVLGTDGKLPSSIIPASAITDTFTANSQSAMLALSQAKKGDICVRTDINKSFILKAEPYSTLANWQELLVPTGGVQSVNGQTGAVNLTASDVGALPDTTDIPVINHGTLYFTRNGGIVNSFTNNQVNDSYFDISMPPDTLYYGEMDLDEDQKRQARTNIGAGTSNFSGYFQDLQRLPSLVNSIDGATGHITGIATKTYVDTAIANAGGGGGQTIYDLVITTQQEFTDFYTSLDNGTCTAKSVLFVGDGGTLRFTRQNYRNNGLILPDTLKRLDGINNAIIEIKSFYGSFSSLGGISYRERKTSADYSINGLTLLVTSYDRYANGFYNCCNITNCKVQIYSSYGYCINYCKNVTNCNLIYEGGEGGYMCNESENITNCTISSNAMSGCIDNCKNFSNCNITTTNNSKIFNMCSNISNCIVNSSYETVSTYCEVFKYSNNISNCNIQLNVAGALYTFYSCYRICNCNITNTATVQSTSSSYGLYNCRYVSNCSGSSAVNTFLGGTNTFVDTESVG